MQRQSSLLRLVPAIILGLCATTAHGQDYDWYVEGSAGVGYIETGGGDAKFDGDDIAMRVAVGKEATRFLSVEVAYTHFDDISDTVVDSRVDIDLQTLELALLARVERGGVDVFARLGVAAWDTDVTADFLGIVAGEGADGGALLLGLGATANVSERLAIRGQWHWYDINDYDDVSALTIGAIWRF